MKAIKILNKFKTFFGVQNVLIHADIDEAIAELEALQQPKSCEGCRYGAFGVNGLGFEVVEPHQIQHYNTMRSR